MARKFDFLKTQQRAKRKDNLFAIFFPTNDRKFAALKKKKKLVKKSKGIVIGKLEK